MITMRAPSLERLEGVLRGLSSAQFSYPEIGATRGPIPKGYHVDRYSAVIGHGDVAFERAKQAIHGWAQFDLPWIEVLPEASPTVGTTIAVVAQVFGFWWTNISRVVYTIDEPNRFGFAYGTLPIHAESGEERFEVERAPGSDEIIYRILAFSRPRHPLARLGLPFARAVQRRFATGSIEAMSRIADENTECPGSDR